MTARTTPTYLLCWFALASLGAVTVPTDPSGTAQELAGLVAQVQPRVVVTDAAMRDMMSTSGIADAATLLDIDVLLGDWRLLDTHGGCSSTQICLAISGSAPSSMAGRGCRGAPVIGTAARLHGVAGRHDANAIRQ